METLPTEMQSLVSRSAEVWVPGKYNGLTPSVFRHLTYWPKLLALFTSRLEGIEGNSAQGIGSVATQALKTANAHASLLGNSSNELPSLNNSDRQLLREVLEIFIDGMLARGVIIVPTLRSLLPLAERTD